MGTAPPSRPTSEGDAFKPRHPAAFHLTGIIGQCIVLTTLIGTWLITIHSYAQVLGLGMLLRVVVTCHSCIAAMFTPLLAKHFGIAAISVAIAFPTYTIFACNAPSPAPPENWAEYLYVPRGPDAWWFILFCEITSGIFSSLGSSLTIYFSSGYGLSAVTAGYCAAAWVLANSMVRPFGGAPADRLGGIPALSVMYMIAAAALITPTTVKSRWRTAWGIASAGATWI